MIKKQRKTGTSIKYDNKYGSTNVDVNVTIPRRRPDLTVNMHAYYTADGECCKHIDYWFKEMLCVSVNVEHKPKNKAGVVGTCPQTGHLMTLFDGDSWRFAVKEAHKGYVDWLAEQHLLGSSK